MEGLMQAHLAWFPQCLEECTSLPKDQCCDQCIDRTIARMQQLDPQKEFGRFLEFSEWQAQKNTPQT